MTSPRTPRQWGPRDSEPDRSLTLQDQDRDLIAYNFDEARGNVGWRYTWIAGHETYYGGVPWSEFDESFRVAWPLSEVLPETPEPTGAQGCNAQSSWNGNHEIKYCARPVGHPDEHRSSLVSEWDTLKWRDDDDPVPASQSVHAVPVSSTGGKGAGEAAEPATEALSVRPVGPRPSREELGHRVAEVCLKWSREDDEREGATATWEALNSHRRELYMRVGEALFGLGMTWSPVPSLPDSETEWEVGPWIEVTSPLSGEALRGVEERDDASEGVDHG